jgi:hypothetical protein
MRCIALSLGALAMACAGGDDGDDAAHGAVAEDPRSMTEICTTYCQNGADHGCESLLTFGAPTCLESCDITCPCDAAERPACRTAYKNHSACLADTPNVCDAQVRDDYCLDAFCTMRRACDLPDPKCR